MDKEDYLGISKASDIKNFRGRSLYRFFELLPGIISLGTLLGVLIFSWLLPSWVAIFIICFCFYYLFRIFYFSLHQIVGYFRVKKAMETDWLKELKKIKKTFGLQQKDWKNIYHVIILPTYKEGRDIIEESMAALVRSNYPKEKMIVVLAVEERAGQFFINQAQQLMREYSAEFYKFLVVTHPDGIVGEVSGKGSNTACAGKEVKAKILDPLKIPYEDVLISTFDIDTKVFPQYFTCLTWYYLTENNPMRASYQPVPVYNNNIWSASLFSRVVSTSNTFWQMIQQERSEKLTTYSSHSTPAKVFFEVGYPANVVSDDSRIFWKSYLYYDGNYRVVPIYYLVSMDAVMAKNIFRTVLNQYNKKISFWQKIGHLYTIMDGFWSWATAALLLFLLGWLPIVLGGKNFNFSVLSFNLPILTSQIMMVSMIGMLVSAVLSTMLLPPVPKNMKWYIRWLKKSTVFFQWIFLPITLIAFGAMPALDAQVRLMIGNYIGFWVTEKVRK